VRRSVENPEELTAHTVFSAEGTTLKSLGRTAGSRSCVEISFEEANGELGLSHCHQQPFGIQERTMSLVLLTVSEVRKLLWRSVLLQRPPPWEDVLSWSVWRRHHQAVARRCHYKRGGVLLT
jgi:hypothetical protein